MADLWPDHPTLMAALDDACRAPSVHNTQPWRWFIGSSTLHLMADRTRWLRATDPHGRDLLVSCGAALGHLRVALAARGWAAVDRGIDPSEPDHLAALELRPTAPHAQTLAATIRSRRTDRRRYSGRPVALDTLTRLMTAAGRYGVAAIAVTDPEDRVELVVSLLAAAARQAADPIAAGELTAWTGRSRGLPDGVLAASAPAGTPHHGGIPMRPFRHGALPDSPTGRYEPDAGELLVLSTADDTPRSWLRAGEAASAVLLTATALGLATCPLSQNLEVDRVRTRLRSGHLASVGEPQLLIRVGYAPIAAPTLPVTPRRPVDEVCVALPGCSRQAQVVGGDTSTG